MICLRFQRKRGRIHVSRMGKKPVLLGRIERGRFTSAVAVTADELQSIVAFICGPAEK